MPNILDANGLQLATQAELVAYFTAQYQSIYGADINLASDTPDGQMLNIYVQSVLDLQDLLAQIYNSFDPDNATGVVLDQRVSINGIQRQAGTYTITPVTLVTSQSINLYGLDQTLNVVYTVADNAGNLWQLQTTFLCPAAGTYALNFQAADPGATLTVPNTIKVPVTIVLGVVSINNPTTYTTLGINEETDAVLKVRRQQSVSLPSQGYLSGLLAALENIAGVTSAYVYENLTGTTNSDGVPGHSIWVIVAGSGAASLIANAIYTKRNAGCGMYGQTSYAITQVDGSTFLVYWDSVVIQNLFIKFTATSINGTTAPNLTAILAQLPVLFVPGVNAEVNITSLGTLVQKIDANTLVTNAGFTTGQTQILTLSGVAASGAFVANLNGVASASINWNDSAATIQTKLRAIAGLSAINVTGSIASQTLTLDLSAIPSVPGLIYITTNTLLTSGSVAITFAFNEGYSNTLSPTSKRYQFAVSAANTLILNVILSPVTSTVAHTATETFTAVGGYAPYIYSFQTNNSGGSINGTTGVYTAGSSIGVTDTILVTDAFGKTATATVSVT